MDAVNDIVTGQCWNHCPVSHAIASYNQRYENDISVNEIILTLVPNTWCNEKEIQLSKD